MGQYGGGVEGKLATEGLICKLAAVATVITVLGAALVGGLVAGGVVGLGNGIVVLGGVVVVGAVVATVTVVVQTGLTVVVSLASAAGSAGCCPAVDEATTRRVS